jgi:indolepyruvate ferredoxin oxidoreductase beta subunit
MSPQINIVIAGVGGQGTVLASRVLGQAALNAGFSALTSETIGMAQREGSVQSHVRIGFEGVGPLIGRGQADILLGFEPAETMRALAYLKPSGRILANRQPVYPVTVAQVGSGYPLTAIMHCFSLLSVKTAWLDAFTLALTAGNHRTLNTIMLGALSGLEILPFSSSLVLRVLLETVPPQARLVNQAAFEIGSRALYEKEHVHD